MRAASYLLDQVFGGRVVLFETVRVVADQVYPRRAPPPPRTDQGAVVHGGEPYLEERVGQTRRVHLFIEVYKPPAGLEGVLERYRKLQLLVQVVDRAVEGLVALQHEVGPALYAVDEG